MRVLQLLFNHNSEQGILDLVYGDADVALARADILETMVSAGLIDSMDTFKCVTSVSSLTACALLATRPEI